MPHKSKIRVKLPPVKIRSLLESTLDYSIWFRNTMRVVAVDNNSAVSEKFCFRLPWLVVPTEVDETFKFNVFCFLQDFSPIQIFKPGADEEKAETARLVCLSVFNYSV